jgi:lipopolysaccharide/colanic/teichoic acid biosynthesis glycosyltransferase
MAGISGPHVPYRGYFEHRSRTGDVIINPVCQVGAAVAVETSAGAQLIAAPISAHARRYLNGALRRALDLFIALSLIVLLMLLFCIIALAVRVSSPGPLLFRQARHGRGMRRFELLKFRSMYWNPEGQHAVVQAVPGDRRVTRVGQVLRKSSMDELPQLINVVRGEMSLIGPRPQAIEHDLYYCELIPDYCLRFRALPGLTGLAQINGARGQTPHVNDMHRRIKFDLDYLAKASLLLDCEIFLLTLREVFRSETAF